MKFKDLPMKIIISLLILPLIAFPQKRKKTKPVRIEPNIIEPNSFPIPEIKDFAFVIEIDENAKTTLKIQTSEGSDALENADLTKFFSEFSRLQNSTSKNKASDLLDPIVIIKPNHSLKYEDIITVIQAARISYTQKIKVEIAKDFYVGIPPKPMLNNEIQVKPNPLSLVVDIGSDLKITLNKDEMGLLHDLSKLEKSLVELFHEREINGVFRERTNEIEKTVFVKAPLPMGFIDIVKVIEGLKKSGASPIFLQVDDLN